MKKRQNKVSITEKAFGILPVREVCPNYSSEIANKFVGLACAKGKVGGCIGYCERMRRDGASANYHDTMNAIANTSKNNG